MAPSDIKEVVVGTMSLQKLFEHTNGDFSVTLTDSARNRTFQTQIDYELTGQGIRCWKRSSKSENRVVVTLPIEVQITADMIPFIGLYEGDGNKGSFKGKASNIGFGGAHYSLQRLALQNFSRWFGTSFSTNWHVLTDSRQFFYQNDSWEIRSDLLESFAKVEQELLDRGVELSDKTETIQQRVRNKHQTFSKREIEIAKEMLQIDFISNCEKWKIEINNHDKITSVIHPGKGGYEIIQYLDKSSWFAPVWLIIVNSIVDTIIENKTTDTRFSNWLNWIDKPHSISVIKLDMKSFISDRTKVVKDSIQTDFYKHNELIDNRLFIGSSERFSFEIPATYDISCLDLLIAGFYLAEGTSSKDDIANLGSQTVPHNKFAIGFNQTEERLISAMIKWLQDLKIKVPWGVKIGEKYRSEYATAAVLQASIPMMQGMKGQGNERSIEMWRMMKRWGLDSFDFSDSENPFRVLQCTGAGIPRPWITGISKRPAVMVMALFRDMTYFLHKLKLHSRSRI